MRNIKNKKYWFIIFLLFIQIIQIHFIGKEMVDNIRYSEELIEQINSKAIRCEVMAKDTQETLNEIERQIINNLE